MRYLGIALTHLGAAIIGVFITLVLFAAAMHGSVELTLSTGQHVMCIPLQ